MLHCCRHRSTAPRRNEPRLCKRSRAAATYIDTAARRYRGTMCEVGQPNVKLGPRHGDHLMKSSLAALALGCALTCSSLAALAGSASPEMGASPSQSGVDPRTQGNDTQRQGVDTDPGNGAMGIRRGMNTGSMSNGTGGNNDADLPGGSTSGSGSTGSNSKGSSGSSSSAGGAGG